ncbi:MAG TPA: ribose-phosphate diphosphokinase [Lentisphaeria bacterium]|nr:MAG: ribose-phosphate pyrophosphokinase [Lentisphaerae bacterium GWF2_38_69]HBM17158.1 ribose-phosphate diphosphokinase [Lentisphaeria bacterium]
MYTRGQELFVFSGSAHPKLAKDIAEQLGITLGNIKIEHFPDGEIFVQYLQNIRGGDVFLIQPTCYPPNETLMELLIMIDAAMRASAGRITAVIPYYGYARQDRKDKPRVAITSKLVANVLIAAGVNRVLTMDLHAQQIMGFFDIPVDHLYAAPVLYPHLKKALGDNAVVVAPDSGSVKMAHAYASALGAGLAVISKRRTDALTVESSHLVGEVKGRTCLIIDDLTSTAGTLIAGANLLKKEGANRIIAATSHCLMNDLGIEKLESSIIEELYSTDSVPEVVGKSSKLKIVSIAPIMAEAIRRIHAGGSLSSLFKSNVK